MIIIENKKNKIGSIYFDKTRQKWRCTYYAYKKDTFEEIRKTKSFSTEQEAKEFLTSIQYQKGNNLFIKNNGIPLNQLMRENVERKLDANLIGERTYGRQLKTIRQIERNQTIRKNINDITSNEIQSYFNTLKNYSNSTIKKIVEQFSQAYEIAMNNGYIVKNPMKNVVRPKSIKPNKIVRALTVGEQQKLTNYLINTPIAEQPYKVAYLIEMFLGLRIGEVLALRSTDIDLNENLIFVNKTLTRDKNDKVIMGKATKTYAGIRKVPIPLFIKNEIIDQVKLSEKNKDKQLFLDINGNYVRPTNANDRLREALRKLGIEGVSSHSLRHTYATRCIESGVTPVVIQKIMGHADVKELFNTYATVFDEYKETEIEKVYEYYHKNEIFFRENQKLLQKTGIYTNFMSPDYVENYFYKEREKITKMRNQLTAYYDKQLISLEEYEKNVEFLQRKEQRLNEEERESFKQGVNELLEKLNMEREQYER